MIVIIKHVYKVAKSDDLGLSRLSNRPPARSLGTPWLPMDGFS